MYGTALVHNSSYSSYSTSTTSETFTERKIRTEGFDFLLFFKKITGKSPYHTDEFKPVTRLLACKKSFIKLAHEIYY